MKKINVGIIVLTLLIVVFSSSLAFYAAKIVGNGKGVDVIAKNVSIKLTNGGLIGDAVITPGWNKTNTFTVSNNSKGTFRYNIIIQDYINTFETVGNLQYKITSSTGYNMTDFEELPKASETRDLVLAYNISIDKDTTQNYTVEIKYVNSEEDQSADMGKTIGGTLYITENTNKIVTYNTNSIGSKLLSDNTTKLTRASFDSVYTKTNTNTLFTSTEDDILVYYFAGDAKNNWVKFGTWSEDKTVVIGRSKNLNSLIGKSYSSMSECTSASDFNQNCTTVELAKKGDPMYWRIVRTNTDGSLKLLYAGTSVTSETAFIAMNEFNSKVDDPMYVGYMYGTSGSLENNRLNTNDSDAKKILDSWYKTNLLSYEDYISKSSVYCADRNVGSRTYGTNQFFYAPYYRLFENKAPTYNCSNNADKFTVDSSAGNGKLTYPVGLLTGDEISYAGGVKDLIQEGTYSYYYSNSVNKSSVGKNFWYLMSPYINYTNNSGVMGVHGLDEVVNGNAFLGFNCVNYSSAIRPVISINADAVYKSGDGSSASPYEIESTPKRSIKTFSYADGTLGKKLLEDKTARPGARTNFSTILTTENTKTLYNGIEDDTYIYYFSGNATDNWVKFGGYYWRIIRTNSDGSIRLLYHGTNHSSTNAYISETPFNVSPTDSMYVGYMYGTSGSLELNRTNTNNSNIKTTIDNWYKSNLNTNYGKYLSDTAVYCNDREVGDGTYSVAGSDFSFASFYRVGLNRKPTYDCSNVSDRFTVSSSTGNGKLTYPIALMTADEVVFAGAVIYKEATTYIYYNSAKSSSTGSIPWGTMSPCTLSNSYSRLFAVIGSEQPGFLSSGYLSNPFGVRPVTSLKACVKWKSGDGTASSPYTIDESYSC